MCATINKYYTYALLDGRKPGTYNYGIVKFDHEPIYIGKGTGSRLNNHTKSYSLKRGLYKDRKIKNILSSGNKVIVVKIDEDISKKSS